LPIRRMKGQLRVHQNAILQGWGHYLEGQKLPSPSAVGKALASISTGAKARQKIGNLHAYVIDTGQLQAALTANGADIDLAKVLDPEERS
jgi:hypothetical protein